MARRGIAAVPTRSRAANFPFGVRRRRATFAVSPDDFERSPRCAWQRPPSGQDDLNLVIGFALVPIAAIGRML